MYKKSDEDLGGCNKLQLSIIKSLNKKIKSPSEYILHFETLPIVTWVDFKGGGILGVFSIIFNDDRNF